METGAAGVAIGTSSDSDVGTLLGVESRPHGRDPVRVVELHRRSTADAARRAGASSRRKLGPFAVTAADADRALLRACSLRARFEPTAMARSSATIEPPL